MCVLQMPDKDLEVRRMGQRVDPMTGDMYTQEMYAPDRPVQQVRVPAVLTMTILFILLCYKDKH